jgi:two-component system NtrC family sensor kinase
LNTPLSIVIGHAVLLEEEAEDAGQAELVDRAERIRLAAERCGETVSSFLFMARQRGVRRELVKVCTLLRWVFRLFEDAPSASDVELIWEVPTGLPGVWGDANQLHHMVSNLIVNARQALEGSPPPRQIRVTANTAGALIEIAVNDTGPGVPDEIRSRIFDPFFTTKKPGAGTGIGLAVSRGIAEAHGGSLVLAPSAHGARFVLRLPLADALPATTDTIRRPTGQSDETTIR